jgi:hypothetical protein
MNFLNDLVQVIERVQHAAVGLAVTTACLSYVLAQLNCLMAWLRQFKG